MPVSAGAAPKTARPPRRPDLAAKGSDSTAKLGWVARVLPYLSLALVLGVGMTFVLGPSREGPAVRAVLGEDPARSRAAERTALRFEDARPESRRRGYQQLPSTRSRPSPVPYRMVHQRPAARAPLVSLRETAVDEPRLNYPGMVPEAEPPKMPGMVIIRSSPPGARVELDGAVLGLTPMARARPADFRGGEVTVRLTGFAEARGALVDDGQGNLRFDAELRSLDE